MPEQPPEDTGKPRLRRPTLAGTTTPGTLPNASILQALEGKATLPAKRGNVMLWLGLSAVAVAFVAWMALRPDAAPALPDQRIVSAETTVAKTSAPANPPDAASPALPMPMPQTVGSAPAGESPAPAVARLEELPVATANVPAADAASSTVPPGAAVVPVVPPGAATAAAAAATTTALAAVTPTSPPSPPKTKPRPAADRSSNSRANSDKPPRRAEPQRTASAKPPANTSKAAAPPPAAVASARPVTPAADRDVDLMAALMSHVSPPEDNAPRALPRSDPATIAGLVAGCRTKPKAEAEQCRREICDGYWGKAQACPARGRTGNTANRPAARPASTTISRAAPQPPAPDRHVASPYVSPPRQ